jgi:hypothetical protein
MQRPRRRCTATWVVALRGPCPPSRRRPRGSAGRSEAVDVDRHRVVREAGCPRGYIAVYRSMNSPQTSGLSPLA